MFKWFQNLGIGNEINEIRKLTIPLSKSLPDWILYSLPDGLWVFSYMALMLFIWNRNITAQNILWFFLVPILAIGSEVFQYLKFLPGTFDPKDLLIYFLGTTLPFVTFRNSLVKKTKFNGF